MIQYHRGDEEMKLICYEENGARKIGRLEGQEIYQIMNCHSINELILEELEWKISEKSVQKEEVMVLAPIPEPNRNIICLGKNYLDHAEEMKDKISEEMHIPENPIYFAKMTQEVLGTQREVDSYSSFCNSLDYEVELAVIIGKQGKDINPEDAKHYIFGYSVSNDFSMRELQVDHFQWFKGKSMDTHSVLGPVIVTADEISYPPVLGIRTYVNGELRQNSTTDKLIFDIDRIISDFSRGTTLIPGDIILTGTPAGVGMGFTPPKYLSKGDVVKCQIDQIGEILNYIK
jgi:2-keto-4-pentenoate hydratase/2-oxohepta-3-ene-1,7-dioic acid hydratase in catechol pathway